MSFIGSSLYAVCNTSEILKLSCTKYEVADDGRGGDERLSSRFISGVAWADESVTDCHVLSL